MTIETFTKEQFESALPSGWLYGGLVSNEHTYKLPVDGKSFVMVRSSVGQSGVSAGTGDDSIRLWLVDRNSLPLAGKLQRWIARTPGWASRVITQYNQLTNLRQISGDCSKCGEPLHIFESHKPGSDGQLFARCPEHGGFKWLDKVADSDNGTAVDGKSSQGMIARYGTICVQCKGRIRKGDRIVRNTEGTWVHETCPKKSSGVLSKLGLRKTTSTSAVAISDLVSIPSTAARETASTISVTKPPALSESDLLRLESVLAVATDTSKAKGEATVATTASSSAASSTDRPFSPSRFQSAIFDFVSQGEGNGVIEGVAGCGKTITIVKSINFTPTSSRVMSLAFNRSIARELQKKVPPHVIASTFHSAGLKIITQTLGRVKIDENKDDALFAWITEGRSDAEKELLQANRATILRLVSLCKNTLFEPGEDSLGYLADRYGLDLGMDEEYYLIVETVKTLFKRSVEQDRVINFDDMIYYPAIRPMKFDPLDWLFVDETQDLNAAQIKMLLKLTKSDGRIVAVGDRAQSIYGFRGADTEALPRVIRALNAKQLPLSITYRCPTKHVELAREFVPQIEARPDAPDGIVETISPRQFNALIQDNDLVLCRVNAPLVRPVFELIRSGRKAFIVGRDIGKSLGQLVGRMAKKYGADDLETLLINMTEYVEREVPRLLMIKKANQAGMLQDQYDTVVALADGCNSLDELIQRIDSIFSDDTAGIRFSSVHRAKGLESNHVFILRRDLMPHPMASQGWQKDQERNIEYVALTRSKESLYFVE